MYLFWRVSHPLSPSPPRQDASSWTQSGHWNEHHPAEAEPKQLPGCPRPTRSPATEGSSDVFVYFYTKIHEKSQGLIWWMMTLWDAFCFSDTITLCDANICVSMTFYMMFGPPFIFYIVLTRTCEHNIHNITRPHRRHRWKHPPFKGVGGGGVKTEIFHFRGRSPPPTPRNISRP